MTKITPNQQINFGNTQCMLYSLVKPRKTHRINISETANTLCPLKSIFNNRIYPQST